MNPVLQTITEVAPERGIFGNCFQAGIGMKSKIVEK